MELGPQTGEPLGAQLLPPHRLHVDAVPLHFVIERNGEQALLQAGRRVHLTKRWDIYNSDEKLINEPMKSHQHFLIEPNVSKQQDK